VLIQIVELVRVSGRLKKIGSDGGDIARNRPMVK